MRINNYSSIILISAMLHFALSAMERGHEADEDKQLADAMAASLRMHDEEEAMRKATAESERSYTQEQKRRQDEMMLERRRESLAKERQAEEDAYQEAMRQSMAASRPAEVKALVEPIRKIAAGTRFANVFDQPFNNQAVKGVADNLNASGAQVFSSPATGDCGLFVLGISRDRAADLYRGRPLPKDLYPIMKAFDDDPDEDVVREFASLTVHGQMITQNALTYIGHLNAQNIFVWDFAGGSGVLVNAKAIEALYNPGFENVHVYMNNEHFGENLHFDFLVPNGAQYNSQRLAASAIQRKLNVGGERAQWGEAQLNLELYKRKAADYLTEYRRYLRG